MSEKVIVALDAMGGDNAPGEIIKGSVMALAKNDKVSVVLVGKENAIYTELKKYQYDESRLSVVNATEVIGFNEPPAVAVRRKKDSSIVVAMKLVRNGDADAFGVASFFCGKKESFTQNLIESQRVKLTGNDIGEKHRAIYRTLLRKSFVRGFCGWSNT